MAVAYSRISNATVDNISFYDPAAQRRADAMSLTWDGFFAVSSQEWLYKLEFGWWKKYCDTVFGSAYYKNNANGQLVSAFDTSKLIKSDQTLIRLDTFGAIDVFYQSLVTDVANVNPADAANYEFSQKRCQAEWEKALQLMNFYDLSGDGVITKLEENYTADVDYFNNDRRYF